MRAPGSFHPRARAAWPRRAAGAVLFVLVLAAAPAAAERFLDQELTGTPGEYLVLNDVNVRSAPSTGASRVGGLESGERVSVRGEVDGWLAIDKDGEPYGFAFARFFMALLDGSLEDELSGTVEPGNGTRCSFAIRFTGHEQAAEGVLRFANYEADMHCRRGSGAIALTAFMFLTEGPYAPGKPHLHQIGIDVLELAEGVDEVFSTTVLFDRGAGEVVFDGVSLDRYAQRPDPDRLAAESAAGAVAGALRLALSAWNGAAWDALFGMMQLAQ